ncbi:MAG TPA: ADYC domain-containing protein [Sorangium sp.]|nr:ADYC domain-containing protein [Sorangium sp.]
MQSRLVRGGCLENFTYVIAERDGSRVSPPSVLPSIVRGYHDPGGENVDLRVETSTTDVCIKDASGRAIDAPPLYEVWAKTSDKGEYNLCSGIEYQAEKESCPNEVGALKGKAIAVPGYWDKKGRYASTVDGKSVVTLACISGVAAKCVHWGYVPWATYPHGTGTKLAEHHEACVIAARARYLNNDTSYTCDNTLVDIFDGLGIRQKDAGSRAANLAFEAAWGAEGLVCLKRARYEGCEDVFKTIGSRKRCQQDYNPGEAWPQGTLLLTRSEPGRLALQGKCPVKPELCTKQ